MNTTHIKPARRSFGLAVKSLLSSSAVLLLAGASTLSAHASAGPRTLELPAGCDRIAAPADSTLVFHVYAVGVQIYSWTGTAWMFVAPAAVLYADADHRAEVGTHYAGPTWESSSGSKIVEQRVDGCSPDATAIQWLLLKTVAREGSGVFNHVTHVQRVNTAGGLQPAQPGATVGDEAQVPYTAEYFFYSQPTE